ncbi:MerR family transcriptional regulator, partial [Nocardioides sp.]|uniref:MerR family transcriptional regulator n=1 Tax=Nocardioides sp. TaxID=35761 RepID=UPI0027157D76
MRLMSIGDAARASGLSAKALRLYDETGLLPPAEVDPVTGYRWYAADQLDRARLVAQLRLAGMPLARIRVVADLAGRSSRAAAAELMSWWRQVEADTASGRALVTALVAELDQEETNMSTIQQ